MKQWIQLTSLLLSVLLIAGMVTALPVSAATEDEAVGGYGDTTEYGSWGFSEATGVLTISGSGAMTDYSASNPAPWESDKEEIRRIEVNSGITAIGSNAFSNCPNVQTVSLPAGLTSIGSNAFFMDKQLSEVVFSGEDIALESIGFGAFSNCQSLWYFPFNQCERLKTIGVSAFISSGLHGRAEMPQSLQKIDTGAFAYSALGGMVLPNPYTELVQLSVGLIDNNSETGAYNPDFTVYGYEASTARNYADAHGLRFVDLDARESHIFYSAGKVLNLATGQYTDRALTGERLRLMLPTEPYARFQRFVSDDVEIEETDGSYYFTMPDHTVTITAETEPIPKLEIVFGTNSQVMLRRAAYDCLLDVLSAYKTGANTYDLDQNGTDDIEVGAYYARKLATNSVPVSIAFPALNRTDFAPISFVFAPNVCTSGRLWLQMPEAGDAYDWQTDSAKVTPVAGEPFQVTQAKWYNEWGIAPETFEGGKKYFVEMTIKPDSGYGFMLSTFFSVDNASCRVMDMSEDGSVRVVTAPMYVAGEKHPIHVYGGFANPEEGETKNYRAVHEAAAGERLFLCIGEEDIADDEYVVQGSLRVWSDQVACQGEAGQYFIMPDEDVAVTLDYETRKQTNGVMDLRGGSYTTPQRGETFAEQVTSQDYGMYILLLKASADTDTVFNSDTGRMEYRFDIDGDGNADVLYTGNTYSLSPTCSLHDPTGKVTLRLSREQSMTVPMRTLTILFADATVQPHRLYITNGIALNRDGNRITEAYAGERVYLDFNPDDIAADEYVVQRSMDFITDDVTVNNEGDALFTMPDKDVSITITYQKAKLTEGVMDLRTGSYIANAANFARSEAYGMSFILGRLSKRQHSYLDEETNTLVEQYDVDNYGGYDIAYDDAAHTFTLLEGNSLRPASGRITLTLPRSAYYTVPMLRMTILLAGEDAPHTVTVKNGFATSMRDDADFLLTNEYQGQEVYLLNDPQAVPEGKYIVSRSFASDDVTVQEDGSFVMPDHDVTVTVSYRLADQTPYTLDLTSGKAAVTFTVAMDVTAALENVAKVTTRQSHFTLYDMDGDGAADIRFDANVMEFEKCSDTLTGVMTLDVSEQVRAERRFCPVTLLLGKTLTGDVNGDGKVDITDATYVQMYIAGMIPLGETARYNADINRDGKIDITDATFIQMYVAGILDRLG